MKAAASIERLVYNNKVLRGIARAATPFRDRSHIHEISGRKFYWPNDPVFQKTLDRIADIPGIPPARCYELQSAIRAVAAVCGDVAECGVRYGRSTVSLLMADTESREYFLFDSWAGLSTPGKQDATSDVEPWKAGDIASDEAITRKNLADWQNVHFLRGWIPDRFSEVGDRCFAFVHVDVDLYEPTIKALQFFADRLAPGAVLMCDDYGSLKCPGARRACDEFVRERGAKLFEAMTGQALIFDVPTR